MAALAELDMFGNDGHLTVVGDLDEGPEGPELGFRADAHQVAEGAADQQAAAGDHGADDQDLAAGRISFGDRGMGVHGRSPHALAGRAAAMPAASLMAARIRGYVPHRQMFPAMAASMSASLGALFSVRRAAALMIWPDWQ